MNKDTIKIKLKNAIKEKNFMLYLYLILALIFIFFIQSFGINTLTFDTKQNSFKHILKEVLITLVLIFIVAFIVLKKI